MYSIGLDISKSTINVYVPYNDLDLVIDNNLKSLKSLYSKLKKQYKKDIDKLVFVYEPTGNYSSVIKKFAANKNIKCFIVNPKQSSNFSKAIGCKNRFKPGTNVGVRPDAKTEFNRTVKRSSTGH